MSIGRKKMSVIDDSLVSVGNDSIKDLYEFIADQEKKTRGTNRFSDQIIYSRVLFDLSMAIISYAGNKVKKEK